MFADALGALAYRGRLLVIGMMSQVGWLRDPVLGLDGACMHLFAGLPVGLTWRLIALCQQEHSPHIHTPVEALFVISMHDLNP
jgi:hypothetical protein